MDVAIEQLAGLPAVSARDMWARCVEGGYPSLAGLRRPGNSCYVVCAAQALLRVPAVAVWLQWHARQCGAGGDDEARAKNCAACCLWRSRRSLGASMTAPAADLIRYRELVDARFADGRHHDVVEFVAGLLQRMRAGEAAAGRSAPWPRGVVSATSACTHVDRLFAHLREARARCVVCGRVRVEFTESSVLELPLRADGDAFVSVTDLYVEYCRLQPSSEDGTTVFCDRCERRTEWWVQGRVVRVPNVLLVQVRRTARDGTLRRFPVQVEEHLTLPELPPLELSSVVYRDGASMDFGHYTCACRAPDGRFWFFDDVRRPACVPEISGVKPRSVYVLVYTTPRGCSAFADQGGVPPGDGDGGSASVAGPVLGGAAASSVSAGAAALRGAATAGNEAPVFVPRLRPICSVCGERQRDLPPECSCVASRNRDRACAEGAEQDRRNERDR